MGSSGRLWVIPEQSQVRYAFPIIRARGNPIGKFRDLLQATPKIKTLPEYGRSENLPLRQESFKNPIVALNGGNSGLPKMVPSNTYRLV